MEIRKCSKYSGILHGESSIMCGAEKNYAVRQKNFPIAQWSAKHHAFWRSQDLLFLKVVRPDDVAKRAPG